MSKLLLVLLVASVVWGIWRISKLYSRVDSSGSIPAETAPAQPAPVAEVELPPLSPALETSLAQANAGGPTLLKQWLDTYKQRVPEPRLSSIQLDYAQMLVRTDPAQARRVYAEVKARQGADSVLAPRLKRLARTFE
jgi:hypothetical protein